MKAMTAVRSLPGVRRAWPGRHGALTFELRDESGRLRAGQVDAEGQVSLAGYASDAKLPDLSPDLAGELVVHRLHRRAVVLAGDRAIKLVRPGRAQPAAESSREFGRVCAASGLGAAEVLAHTPSRIDFSLLPGRTLHDLGEAGLGGWQRLAEVWPRLAGQSIDLPEHGWRQETEALWRWFDWAAEFEALPGLDRMRTLTVQACRALAGTTHRGVLVHRDLHDKQMLWDGEQLGLLDLDTAAIGEPELDLANLWTHVELRHMQGVFSSGFADRVLGLLDGLKGRLQASEERFAAYRHSARLRLSYVYAFRPSAAAWLPAWVEGC